jgi:hypothetical protein
MSTTSTSPVKTIAVAQAKADAAFSGSTIKTADAIGRIMGENPTLPHWDGVRIEYTTSYKDAAKCSDNAADKAWSRVAAAMLEQFSLEKPKAQSKAATDKAAQRAKAQSGNDAVKQAFDALTGTTAEKLAQCANLIPSMGLKVAAMVLKEDQAQASTVQKEAEARRKALAKALGERLKDMGTEALLKVEAAMDKLTK